MRYAYGSILRDVRHAPHGKPEFLSRVRVEIGYRDAGRIRRHLLQLPSRGLDNNPAAVDFSRSSSSFLPSFSSSLILGIGGCVYAVYRIKKKADELQKTYKTDEIQKLVKSVGAAAGVPGMKGGTGPPFSYPEWTAPLPGRRIPLRHGLTVVTAINQTLGDYESFKDIQKVTPEVVQMTYSANIPDSNPFEERTSVFRPVPSRRVNCGRTIEQADLKSAHEYRESFCGESVERFPGTTALGVSSEVLNELKAKGETSFTYEISGIAGLFKMFQGMSTPKVSCILKRIGQSDSAIPVLVNDQRVQLPAVHTGCVSDDDEADFYFLDDPENPLSLAWQLGGGDKLQVVKITVQQDEPAHLIEQELTQTGRAEVYGIYFDFASATIRAESEPTLREIAAIMGRNPGWHLSVEGHTDNIGGDEYNLDLSRKRAEAVKAALGEQYKISSDRLAPEGFGMTRPKESNDDSRGPRAKPQSGTGQELAACHILGSVHLESINEEWSKFYFCRGAFVRATDFRSNEFNACAAQGSGEGAGRAGDTVRLGAEFSEAAAEPVPGRRHRRGDEFERAHFRLHAQPV